MTDILPATDGVPPIFEFQSFQVRLPSHTRLRSTHIGYYGILLLRAHTLALNSAHPRWHALGRRETLALLDMPTPGVLHGQCSMVFSHVRRPFLIR